MHSRLDTAGTEQFTAMRELYMKQGQGFLLVFSITSMSSLHELTELREQIIRIKDDPNVPLVIVGNKSDLEEDRVVSRQRAYDLSQRWGNAPLLRDLCSKEGQRRRSFCGSLQADHPQGYVFDPDARPGARNSETREAEPT